MAAAALAIASCKHEASSNAWDAAAAGQAASGGAGASGASGVSGAAIGGASGTSGNSAAGAGSSAGSAGTSGSAPSSSDASTSDGANAGANGVDAATDAGDAGAPTPSYPTPIAQHLSIGVHDPSLLREGSSYYLFATGGLLGIRSSNNLTQWSNSGSVFSTLPTWISGELGQNIVDLWAPDISFFAGSYHVYYAGSVFGSNHSVIGLATNVTLDPKAASYHWIDQGLVIESNKTGGAKDDWNAIDPSAFLDGDGKTWLVFGSFWSGIKLRELDPPTGKLLASNTMLYALANHGGGIEAPSIVTHHGYYYLFVSYDTCCKGVNSTYKTVVGRADSVTGPYRDRAGNDMLQDHGELLLASDGRYIGPGGGTAFHDGARYYYAYHYYDGQNDGHSFLMLRPIHWDDADWPTLGDPLWQ